MPLPIGAFVAAVAGVKGGIDWSQWFDYLWLFRGAASYAASKIDVISGQTATQVGGAEEPTWDALRGCMFSPNSALNTGIVPTATTCLMAQFRNVYHNEGNSRNVVAGSSDADDTRMYLWPQNWSNGTDKRTYGHGASASGEASTRILAGNMCVIPTAGYLDGAPDLVIGAWSGSSSEAIMIGGMNYQGTPGYWLDGHVIAAGISSTTMTDVAGAAAAMLDLLSRQRPHIDVSSVIDVDADVVTGCILYLTNASSTATVKFRNFEAGTWYSDLETTIPLTYAHSGGSVAIAVISDTHFGRPACDPAACLTSAIDDIDDNIGGVSYVFVLGDICHSTDEYAAYKTTRATSDIAAANWRELGGNHDYPVLSDFLSNLGYATPYHSLTIGNAVFLFLSPDADNQTLSSTQQAWLSSQLAANASKNVFICTHQGRYQSTQSTGDEATGYIKPSALFESTIEYQQWCAWLCGHSHGYNGVPAPDSRRSVQI